MFVVVSSSSSFAQQGNPATGAAPAAQQERSDAPDRNLASRLAWLKDRLRLSADQERYWSAYEAAVQNLVNDHRKKMDGRSEQNTADPTQQLRERAQAMSSSGAALAGVADAQEPFLNSLDQDQKRRFAELSPAPGAIRIQRPRADDDEDRSSGRRERDLDRDRRDRDYDAPSAGRRSGEPERRRDGYNDDADDAPRWRGRTSRSECGGYRQGEYRQDGYRQDEDRQGDDNSRGRRRRSEWWNRDDIDSFGRRY
jgi:hypothetical protein